MTASVKYCACMMPSLWYNSIITWYIHVLYIQEVKFKEAIGFYEAIVKKNFDNVSSEAFTQATSFASLLVVFSAP